MYLALQFSDRGVSALADAGVVGALIAIAGAMVFIALALRALVNLTSTMHADAFKAHQEASRREDERMDERKRYADSMTKLAEGNELLGNLFKEFSEIDKMRAVTDRALEDGVTALVAANARISELLPAVLSNQTKIISGVEAESGHLDQALQASLKAHEMTQEQVKDKSDAIIAQIAEVKKLIAELRTDMDKRLDALTARLDALNPAASFNPVATLVTEVPAIADVSKTPPPGTLRAPLPPVEPKP